ncbi:MAG TPA: peptidoglycan recognition family protein [Hyphomicrobiaceae bacterium]|jgi:hypothetical protein|nr:peptidoglycan recognition family protein [Hyphomicrobiaceae bacterium]
MSFVRSCLLTAVLACLSPATPTLAADRAAAPPILPRAAWAAKPADTSLMQSQTPREIVIHHTGEKRRPQLTLQEKLQKLQRFSQSAGMVGTAPKPPWGDMPYHFYVDAAGRIAEGRSLDFAGDSNTKYDTANRIQIVVEGHFDQEQPVPAQLKSLDRLVVWLADRYNVPAVKISGHSDHVGNTDCPGWNLKAYLPVLRAKVTNAKTAR